MLSQFRSGLEKSVRDIPACATIRSRKVTMNIGFYVCIIILVVTSSYGQLLNFGPCPEVDTVNYFDIERFLGRWFEIERYPTFYENGHCSSKRFEACGRRIEIEHAYVREDIQFVFRVNSSYNPGDEGVFATLDNTVDKIGAPIEVIATDYTEYALLYGCKYNPDLNIKYSFAWIVSRNLSLPEETAYSLKMALNRIPYSSPNYLERVRQDAQTCAHGWTAFADTAVENRR